MKRSTTSIKKNLLVFTASLLISVSIWAQPVTNSGFESWPSGCPFNVAPDGWINFSQPVGLGPDQAGSCNGPVVSYQDTSHMNLVWSNTGIREGCKQAISNLVPGTVFQVTFFATHDQGLWADTGSVILNFYHNSTVIYSTPELFPGGPWYSYSATFTAIATTDTIGFQVAPGLTGTSGSVGVDAVSFTIPEGVNNLLNENEINIYPNPFESMVTVTAQEKQAVSLSVQNVLGQTVFMQSALNPSGAQSIELSAIPQGIYFFSFVIDGEHLTKKIIKL